MDSADSLSIEKSKKKVRGPLFVATGFVIGAILLSVLLYSLIPDMGIPPIASYTLQQSSTTTNYTLTITSMSQGNFRTVGLQADLIVRTSNSNETWIGFDKINGIWYSDAMFKDNDHNKGLTVGDAIYLNRSSLFNTGTRIFIIEGLTICGDITLA